MKDIIITCLTGILSCISDAFKDFWKRAKSPGSPPASESLSSGTIVVVGSKNTVTNNITICFISCEEVSKLFDKNTKIVSLTKDDASGFSLLMQWKSSKPEYLAIGFFAECFFGNKGPLSIWVGFQPREPSKVNTLKSLTFSIELLHRKAWIDAGWNIAKTKEYGYLSDDTDAAYYKPFPEATIETKPDVLYELVCNELKEIAKRLS
jgi:hypothetical protein